MPKHHVGKLLHLRMSLFPFNVADCFEAIRHCTTSNYVKLCLHPLSSVRMDILAHSSEHPDYGKDGLYVKVFHHLDCSANLLWLRTHETVSIAYPLHQHKLSNQLRILADILQSVPPFFFSSSDCCDSHEASAHASFNIWLLHASKLLTCDSI